MASTDPAPSDASCAALLPLGSHATTAPIALRRPVFVIGSRKDIVRLHLQSSTVSKAHCVVVVNAWGCYVHDLGSRTGTMVNGKPIVDHDLSDGDVLQIGRFQFRYQAPRHARPEPAGLPPADVNVSTLTEPLRLHKRVITLGRRVGSDVQFDDSRVSNIHALIVEQDGRRLVRDLSSRTGTWLDEKPVHQEPLPDGAPLRIGGATITLTEPLAPAARAPGAPLTLADAPSASAAAAAGPGVMNLGLITPDLDDANPDDADAVTSPDDTVPAAEDDADDLAALRRGWKAPPRDESAPAAAPIAEAPAPSAEADIDDSDLIPLELEPEPRSAVPPARTPAPPPVAPTPPAEVAARELAPLELEPLALEPLAEAPAEADDAIDLDAIEPPAAAVAVPDRVEDDLDLDLLDEAAPAEADEVVVAPSAEQPVTPEMPADADLAEAEADVDADDLADIEVAEADRPEVIAVPATPRTADVETIDSDAEDAPAEAVAEAVTDTADESDALAPAAVAEPDALVLDEVRPDPDAPAAETDTATEAEAESADALVLDEAAPATGEETPVVVDVLDLPPADAPVIETRAPAATTADAVTTAEPAAEIVAAETPSEETPAAIVAEAPADDVTAVDTLDLEPLDLSEITLAPDPEAPAAATAVAADVAEAATPVAEAAPGLDLLDEADAAADADAADHADVDLDVVSIESVPVPAEVDLVDLAADDRDDAVEDAIDGETIAPEAAAAETMVTPPAPSALAADAATDALADARDPFTAVPEIEPDTEPAGVAAETSVLEPPDLDALDLDTLDLDTLDLDAVDLNVLDEAVAGEAVVEPAPQAARTDAPADTRTAATGVIVGEEIEPVADANLEPALPVAAAEAFVAPAEPIIEPDLVRLSEDSDDDANEATALAVDLGLVLDDDLVHDGPNDVPETTGPVPAAGPVDIDLSSATPVARTPDLAEAAGPASIDLSRLGAIDGPAFQPHALPDHAVAAGDTLTEAFADDGLELIEADRDTATPVAEAPAFGANDTTELAKPDAATADTIDPLDDPFADPFGNRISAPEGGSLADLMPGGPPLLGGSFMHLPPAPPPPEAAGPGERRRPLRVGFSDGRPGPRPTPRRGAPFAAERTIADALGKSAPDDTSELIGHAPSIDAFSGATSVPAPPAVPPRPAAAPTPGPTPDSSPAAEPLAPIDDDWIDSEIDSPSVEIFADANADAKSDVRAAEAAPADTRLADTRLAETAPASAAAADRLRPRGVIRPVALRPEDRAKNDLIASVTPADVDQARAKGHKKRVRRVIACLVGMFVLIGGAAWGVWNFTPLRSTIDALISYDGLDRLAPEEATAFRNRQNEAIVSEQVRQNAVSSLPPEIKSPGFLSDGRQTLDAIVRDPKVRWPADQPTVLRLRVRSGDKENDIARLRALANTLVASADGIRAQIGDLRDRIGEDLQQAGQRKVQLADLNDQLQALQQARASRPELKNLSELNAEFLAAEPALTAIKSRRQELEATVERLSKPIAARPASAPNVDPIAADEELTKLSGELGKLQQSVVRPENTPVGADARKKLDESIATFQHDLSSAQKLRSSPELAAYVEAANRAFGEYRQLIDIFIRYQENQLTQLSELKSKLSDSMQAHAQELIAKDTELKKLKDDLAIRTRQYNAAMASGYGDEARKSELELRLLKVKVAEREDRLKNDSVSGETMQGLQGVIDGIEKDRRNGRRQFDERLTAMQADFMKNAPAVEKLPAEQKKLAEGIESKLAAVNEARRAYNAAAEQAQAEQAKAESASAEQTAALRLKIAARRQDVLAAAQARQAENDEATRREQLTSGQSELTAIRQQEQAAQVRLANAAAAIEAQEKQRRTVAQSDTERQAKVATRDDVEKRLREVQSSIAMRQAQLARLIVPDRKVEVINIDDKDRRPLYLAGAVSLIVLLLGLPILLDLLALAREAHPHEPPSRRDNESGEGFEPVIVEDAPRKALPEPASV